jgi:hypothetical protein
MGTWNFTRPSPLDRQTPVNGLRNRERLTTADLGEAVPVATFRRPFEAGLQVLHYWRDDAGHGKATTINEIEAYASLT